MLSLSSLAQPGNRKLLGLKIHYAKCMWGVRKLLVNCRLFDNSTIPRGKWARYLKSLFAVYDINEMSQQDLAWWTFDAMAWIENFLKTRQDASVFEYGSGASTLWLARRARHVVSIEDDAGFFTRVSKMKPDNVTYSLHRADEIFDPDFESGRHDLRGKSFRTYVRAVDETNDFFDLIVIDGRCRRQCMERAVAHLKPGGAILLDNTDMQRYRDIAPAQSLKKIVTRGLTPSLPYPTETTIYVS